MQIECNDEKTRKENLVLDVGGHNVNYFVFPFVTA